MAEQHPHAEPESLRESHALGEQRAALAESRETLGEMTRFLVLTAVMIGAILVVVLARPYIFGKMVPALMGDFYQPSTQAIEKPLDEEVGPSLEVIELEDTGSESVEEAAPAEGEPVDTESSEVEPAAGNGTTQDSDSAVVEETSPAETVDESNAIEETTAPATIDGEADSQAADPAPESAAPESAQPVQEATQHVVSRGESLIRIAEAYGVSVNDLAALNGLIDINRIREGDVLVIPQPAPGE